jgi:hypothetical protein
MPHIRRILYIPLSAQTHSDPWYFLGNGRTVPQFSWLTLFRILSNSLSSNRPTIRRCTIWAIELEKTNNCILIVVIRIIIEVQKLTQILVWEVEGRIIPNVRRYQSEGVRTGLIAVRTRYQREGVRTGLIAVRTRSSQVLSVGRSFGFYKNNA